MEKTIMVLNAKGDLVRYLTAKDEENGLDIKLDMQGYTLVAI